MKVWGLGACAVLAGLLLVAVMVISRCWYLSTTNGYVSVYQGIEGDVFGIGLSRLDTMTDVVTSSLPESLQHQLSDGIPVGSEDEALATVESYRDQIAQSQAEAESTANQVLTSPNPEGATGATGTTAAEGAEGAPVRDEGGA